MAASSFHIWKCKMNSDICSIMRETIQKMTEELAQQAKSAEGKIM